MVKNRKNIEKNDGKCPIASSVDLLGDRWSLVVIRDIMFGGRRHYRDLLVNSDEGISSNILVDRLKRLTEAGLVSQVDDETHKQRTLYALTEMGITLAPVLVELSKWSLRWIPTSEQHSARTKLFEDGGKSIMRRLDDDLRAEHLGVPRKGKRPSVLDELQRAFDTA